MMFNKKRFKEIIQEKDNMTWADQEDDYRMSKLWAEMVHLITNSSETFNDFLSYMKEEMTGNEYGYLSEISDEIADGMPSYEFIEAYKLLAKKYPEETKRWHIDSFIEDAEEVVKYRLEN